MLISLSFVKEALRILYIKVALCERLVSRLFHFKCTSTDLMSFEAPVMTLPARL